MANRGMVVCAALVLLLPLGGCKKRQPAESSAQPAGAVPAQEQANDAGLVSKVNVGDAGAKKQLLNGFFALENGWRWTGGQFAVELGVPEGASAKPEKLVLHFTIPEVILNKVHKQTMSATVNGTALPEQTYSTSGPQTYSQTVPAAALTGKVVQANFTVSPVMAHSEADARDLGVIATSVELAAE